MTAVICAYSTQVGAQDATDRGSATLSCKELASGLSLVQVISPFVLPAGAAEENAVSSIVLDEIGDYAFSHPFVQRVAILERQRAGFNRRVDDDLDST